MPIKTVDTIILGAGIIGTSVAVHLQKRGRAVLLIDRLGAGSATSFGNAGLIQREGVYPYGFPQGIGALLRYAANRNIDAHYHAKALPKLVPFLWRYWLNSRPAQHATIARQYSKLIEHCVEENRALSREAGVQTLIRANGWIKLFRTAQVRDAQFNQADEWQRGFGIKFRRLDQKELRNAEPHLDPSLIGGLHFTDADTISDPGALVSGYCRFFEGIGGRLTKGDAATLRQHGDKWLVQTKEGPIAALTAVVALGPWADLVTTKFGYRLRTAVKRGYHMHYSSQESAVLNHPVLDSERGYFLAPMSRGIRLTTGVEFADRDAPKSPIQLDRAEPFARSLFPLSERIDAEPWMGLRPCTPDMMPVIGPAPRHSNLWFAFGHGHHGLTLGAVTGRLLAEMIVGELPFIDPSPFRADRPGLC